MKSWHLNCIYYANRQMAKVFLRSDFTAWDAGYILGFTSHLFSVLQKSPLFIKKLIIIKDTVRSFFAKVQPMGMGQLWASF